jgi:hypothetical protein
MFCIALNINMTRTLGVFNKSVLLGSSLCVPLCYPWSPLCLNVLWLNTKDTKVPIAIGITKDSKALKRLFHLLCIMKTFDDIIKVSSDEIF